MQLYRVNLTLGHRGAAAAECGIKHQGKKLLLRVESAPHAYKPRVVNSPYLPNQVSHPTAGRLRIGQAEVRQGASCTIHLHRIVHLLGAERQGDHGQKAG